MASSDIFIRVGDSLKSQFVATCCGDVEARGLRHLGRGSSVATGLQGPRGFTSVFAVVVAWDVRRDVHWCHDGRGDSLDEG